MGRGMEEDHHHEGFASYAVDLGTVVVLEDLEDHDVAHIEDDSYAAQAVLGAADRAEAVDLEDDLAMVAYDQGSEDDAYEVVALEEMVGTAGLQMDSEAAGYAVLAEVEPAQLVYRSPLFLRCASAVDLCDACLASFPSHQHPSFRHLAQLVKKRVDPASH